LITMPAPHASALNWKLEYLFAERALDPDAEFSPAYPQDWTGAVLADVRRLTGPQER
jgi:hypothetical protein